MLVEADQRLARLTCDFLEERGIEVIRVPDGETSFVWDQ